MNRHPHPTPLVILLIFAFTPLLHSQNLSEAPWYERWWDPPTASASPAPADPDVPSGTNENWQSGFGLAGTDRTVYASAWHDGKLFIGGDFYSVGGKNTGSVAMWDGREWHGIGGGIVGDIRTMLVVGSTLYVGGNFLKTEGEMTRDIAAYDIPTGEWRNLGQGIGGIRGSTVFALAHDGERLYAGGHFVVAGSTVAVHLAAWDGQKWRRVGTGANRMVLALDYDGEYLWAGGSFSLIGDRPSSGFARYSPETDTWEDVPGTDLGGDGWTTAITHDDRYVYMSGRFSKRTGSVYNNVARLDRSTGEWSDMDGGVTMSDTGLVVYTVAMRGSDLFVGGRVERAGSTNPGIIARDIAKWDTRSGEWSLLPRTSSLSGQSYPSTGVIKGSRTVGTVADLTEYRPRDDGSTRVRTLTAGGDGDLFIGGDFDFAGPVYVVPSGVPSADMITPDPEAVFAANICRLSEGDTIYSALGSRGVDADIEALYPTADFIYAGGRFFRAGDEIADNVARFNRATGTWESMAGGIEIDSGEKLVTAIVEFNGEIYIGGRFDRAGGRPIRGLARWDEPSGSWRDVGGRGFDFVGDMTLFDNQLAVVGEHGLSYWDGDAWEDIGETDGSAFAVAVDGRNVYVGGKFESIGGRPAANIAVWNDDAGNWSQLAEGTSDTVLAIEPWEEHIYVAGNFSTAGSTPVVDIARWVRGPKRWEKVGPQFIPPTSTGNSIRDLYLGRYGMYVGGSFLGFGVGTSTNGAYNIGLFDGDTWRTLGNGVNRLLGAASVSALAGDGERLYVGGSFHFAGSKPANRYAEWIFPEPKPEDVPTTETGARSPLAAAAGVPDDVHWDDRFNPEANPPGANGEIFALLADDTGEGLYVAGAFDKVTGLAARSIAYWNGVDWETLDDGLDNGVDGFIFALARKGDDLYVGGQFTSAGGVAAQNIAVWNMTSRRWRPLGDGIGASTGTPYVSDIVIDGDQVYVGGTFTLAGGDPAAGVARWDGSGWSPLGEGITGNVNALHLFNGRLYAGGSFGSAGGVTAGSLAWWESDQWHPVSPGVSGTVNDFAESDGELIVGGRFSGGPRAGNLAVIRGDGIAPFTHHADSIEEVRSLLTVGDRLYLGGDYTLEPNLAFAEQKQSNGTLRNIGYQWRREPGYSPWLAMDRGFNGPVNALAVVDGKIVAGGSFSRGGEESLASLARWNNATQTWNPLVSGRILSPISAITIVGSKLYGAGQFVPQQDPTAGLMENQIAWLGTTGWHVIPGTIEGIAVAAGSAREDMIIGGQFLTAGGKIAVNILEWDYTSGEWSPVTPGSGVADQEDDSWVRAIASHDDNVYIGGRFGVVDTFETPHVARFDRRTRSWHPLGEGLDREVTALAVAPDGRLYAGGYFSHSGTRPMRGVACFDGEEWQRLGEGIEGDIHAIAVTDDYVYVGGVFSRAGDVEAMNVAGWNIREERWEAMAGGLTSDFLPGVDALTVIDGTLFAGGFFKRSGGDTLRNIARWAGWRWEPLGSGVDFAVYAMAPDRRDLYVVGSFNQAGAKPSPYIALWHDPTLSVEYVEAPVAGSLTSGPNPVLTETLIRYSIPHRDVVRLSILDLNGREIITLHDGPLSPGEHQARWVPGSDIPAGLYVVRMVTSKGVVSRKVVVY